LIASLRLRSGQALQTRLMIEHDPGVTLMQRYDIQRVDSDFFAAG
jgi:restriction endonuclease Mrr